MNFDVFIQENKFLPEQRLGIIFEANFNSLSLV